MIGPNGSGKTTLLNVLSGVILPSTGRVEIDGRDVTRWPAHRVAAHGVARTFQNIRLFDQLSVLENVEVGAALHPERPGGAALRRAARTVLVETGLSDVADRPARTLPYGIRRRVEIARALATRPTFLLLDEPAAGANEAESDGLRTLIAELRQAHGLGMLVVEHDLRLILRLADRIVVLNEGARIAEGSAQEVSTDPRGAAGLPRTAGGRGNQGWRPGMKPQPGRAEASVASGDMPDGACARGRDRWVGLDRGGAMNARKLVAAAAAAMLVVAACGGGGTDSGTYSIGYDSSQTGGLAYSDVPASKGVQMAIDEINAMGGIAGKWKIELTLQDNRSEAAQSAVVAQDLISKDVEFLICTSDADPCTAAGQIAQKAGDPDDVHRRDVADAAGLRGRLHVHERVWRQRPDGGPRRLRDRGGLQERLHALLARLVVHLEVV